MRLAAAILALLGTAPLAHTAAPAGAPPAIFVDATERTGLVFHHFNGMSGETYMAENLGAGVALLDYDGDGDLDVYFVQGSMLNPAKTEKDTLFPPKHPLPLTDRLFRNDLRVLPGGGRELRFTDVTVEAGLKPAPGYGMGVATGDFDGDGRTDLYVTRLGPNQLLRNRGDGTFEDLTAKAGVQDERWSVPATFLDYDRDGRLDLWVGNYVAFTVAAHKPCFADTGGKDYCGPSAYPPQTDRLFRNRGDGTFEDVSAKAGITRADGGALGVVAADFDGDGWTDVYVANDELENQLWRNRGDGTFEDAALLGGVAVSAEGHAESSMGVDAADYDGDGDDDLYIANLTAQTHVLYQNEGGGLFRDARREAGVSAPTFKFTGFGAGFLDYDNDGRLDLFIANGAVRKIEALVRAGDPYPLHQTNLLLRNVGGRFEDVTSRAGEVFARSAVGRGAAFGDLDDDGDTDVVVSNNNGPARLLLNVLNEAGSAAPWLGLRLVAGEPGRDALGARVEVVRTGKPSLWRRAYSDGSYASASDPRVLVGLGDGGAVEKVRVRWPSGRVEEWTGVKSGVYTTLKEGTGKAVSEAAPLLTSPLPQPSPAQGGGTRNRNVGESAPSTRYSSPAARPSPRGGGRLETGGGQEGGGSNEAGPP